MAADVISDTDDLIAACRRRTGPRRVVPYVAVSVTEQLDSTINACNEGNRSYPADQSLFKRVKGGFGGDKENGLVRNVGEQNIAFVTTPTEGDYMPLLPAEL